LCGFIPQVKGVKAAAKSSHLLKNHNGFVYLHVLDTADTMVNSLPSIDNCAGAASARYVVAALVWFLAR
jgi:hypothetical protein